MDPPTDARTRKARAIQKLKRSNLEYDPFYDDPIPEQDMAAAEQLLLRLVEKYQREPTLNGRNGGGKRAAMQQPDEDEDMVPEPEEEEEEEPEEDEDENANLRQEEKDDDPPRDRFHVLDEFKGEGGSNNRAEVKEVEDENLQEEIVVSCPLDQDDWEIEEEVEEDKAKPFCFFCSFAEDEDRSNELLAPMVRMMKRLTGGDMDKAMAANIQNHYNKHFKDKCGGRVWTINSILDHPIDHMPTPEAQLALVRSTAAKAIRIIKNSGLVVTAPSTGKKYIVHKGVQSFNTMAKLIVTTQKLATAR